MFIFEKILLSLKIHTRTFVFNNPFEKKFAIVARLFQLIGFSLGYICVY